MGRKGSDAPALLACILGCRLRMSMTLAGVISFLPQDSTRFTRPEAGRMKVCWKHPGVLLLPLLAMPLALIISVPANDGLSQNRRGHRPCPNGIEGQVLLGPTCPVITVPPDPKCEDKPYEARITVKSGSGQKGTDAAAKEVARFSSNSKGEFRLCLPPG